MTTKQKLFNQGIELSKQWCALNMICFPEVVQVTPKDRVYYIRTCAFYRPERISIMVPKCAGYGLGGRAWSWPSYIIDRTPYGVMQHELGHHVDHVRSKEGYLFSKEVYSESKERPITGYLGTDNDTDTFYMEWFAENFRLFVTNPDLSKHFRPKFYKAMTERFNLFPCVNDNWRMTLFMNDANQRIVNMAAKKIGL